MKCNLQKEIIKAFNAGELCTVVHTRGDTTTPDDLGWTPTLVEKCIFEKKLNKIV